MVTLTDIAAQKVGEFLSGQEQAHAAVVELGVVPDEELGRARSRGGVVPTGDEPRDEERDERGNAAPAAHAGLPISPRMAAAMS